MVILQWEPPEFENQNGMITSYQVDIGAIDTNSSIRMTFPNTTAQVNNIRPYSGYQIRIAAVTAIGVGPLSHPFSLQTEEEGKASLPHIGAL